MNKILTYKELVYPITYELDNLNKYFGNSRKYSELLNTLNLCFEETDEFPYQKDLLKSLKMKREALVELMNELYEDFQEFMTNEQSYSINETIILFIVTGISEIWIVGPNELKCIPRIGETVFLPTLTRDHEGASYFKVEGIIHEITGGKHIIEVHMN